MSAAISTNPASTGGKATHHAPILVTDSAPTAARFWESYDTDPSSSTAWADAAALAWQSPAAAARGERDIDRWNEEGGSDPD
ncbi:hypothetical protein GSU68_15885 [Rathayibacter sp. VKM Ac-2759]|uniref:hypothetical protein n=1 Tax=Rathayibacter sp. VKM Ac-2759 TaxID=2609252 RepID=UPI001316A27D|nr:hypothetical protein [Rathayibacter sp. VKM Ac-2759]QHC67897.1 hypothetical protein GSU68_15885 [Rathayibacter sp. VKM Ac-2759]